jgi:hypothetical protein
MTAGTEPAGWIYVQHTATDPVKYAGQSSRPVWNRINEERRTLPWGRDILPGRTGYTIVRRVESLGHPTLDAIALDLAEAEVIQERHPTENANRPDPRVFRDRLAAAQTAHAAGTLTDPMTQTPWAPPRAERPHTPRPRGASRGQAPRARTVGDIVGAVARGVGRAVTAMVLITVGVGCAWVALHVARPVGVETGTPWLPWACVPIAFVLGPTWLYQSVVNPPRKRRVYRSRRRRR